jgi:hypothetical protein
MLSMAECLELSEAANNQGINVSVANLYYGGLIQTPTDGTPSMPLAGCMSLGPWDRCCHMHAFQKGVIVTSQDYVNLMPWHSCAQARGLP